LPAPKTEKSRNADKIGVSGFFFISSGFKLFAKT